MRLIAYEIQILDNILDHSPSKANVRKGLDLNLAAHQLLVLIDGLSAERVLYPDRVTPARQQQMLDQLLGGLRREPRTVR